MRTAPRHARGLVGLTLMAACGPSPVTLPTDGNAAPFAHAGTGTAYVIGATIALDGGASYDPDGDIVAYRWRITEAPAGSTATVTPALSQTASLTPDRVGAYVLRLEVEDDRGGIATSDVRVTATSPALVVDAGADRTVEWFAQVQLAGTVTAEPGFASSLQWSLVARPFGSGAVLSGAGTSTPSFRADVLGTYRLQLTGQTAFETRTDTIEVRTRAGRNLGEGVVFAYSATLDRVLLTRGGSPTQSLVIVDPESGAETPIELDLVEAPTAIAVHPGGTRVAVSSFPRVAIVDLATATVEATYDWSGGVWSIAFAPDDRLHAASAEFGGDLQTLSVATGVISQVAQLGTALTLGLHPSGTAMYALDIGGTEAIGRFGIATSPIALQRQAAIAGLSGPLTFTEDGGAIITGTGVVLRSSTSATTDMAVLGSLTTSAYAAAHSAARHQIAAFGLEFDSFGAPRAATMTFFDDATLAPIVGGVVPMAGEVPTPRLVAYRADSARVYIVTYTFLGAVLHTVTPP